MDVSIRTKNVFITSNPGVGKTRLIKEVCLPYMNYLDGFYTEEIRQDEGSGMSKRVGFRLKTFSGEEGILAYKGMKSEYKLNKYGIDINVVEQLGVKSILNALHNKKVIIIDEIGTMECYSELFRRTVIECLNSTKNVLATIRYKSQPFTDEVKRFPDTQLLLLTRENFNQLKVQLRNWLERIILGI